MTRRFKLSVIGPHHITSMSFVVFMIWPLSTTVLWRILAPSWHHLLIACREDNSFGRLHMITVFAISNSSWLEPWYWHFWILIRFSKLRQTRVWLGLVRFFFKMVGLSNFLVRSSMKQGRNGLLMNKNYLLLCVLSNIGNTFLFVVSSCFIVTTTHYNSLTLKND